MRDSGSFFWRTTGLFWAKTPYAFEQLPNDCANHPGWQYLNAAQTRRRVNAYGFSKIKYRRDAGNIAAVSGAANHARRGRDGLAARFNALVISLNRGSRSNLIAAVESHQCLDSSRLTSDTMIGESSRTGALLFPNSANPTNSAKGVAYLQGTSFVGTSPKTPSP